MPFGRPPIADRPLDDTFVRLKRVSIREGHFNAGIIKVQCRLDSNVYIEKRLRPEDIQTGNAIEEITLMRSLKHRNIAEYIHAFVDRYSHVPSASIYMAFCELGSLDDCLEKYHVAGRGVDEGFVWSTFVQLANAIGYIQYGIEDTTAGDLRVPGWRKIVHRDISPRNVFLKRRNHPYPRIVLGDFGSSTYVDMEELVGETYDSVEEIWAYPEAPHFGLPSDIWSMGAVIQAMCRLDGPAERYGPQIVHGRHFRGAGNTFSGQLNFALEGVMENDWRGRPSIRNIAPLLVELATEAAAPQQALPDWVYTYY